MAEDELRTSGYMMLKTMSTSNFFNFSQYFFVLNEFNLIYYEKEPAPGNTIESIESPAAKGTINLSLYSLLRVVDNKIPFYFELVPFDNNTTVTNTTVTIISLAARSATEYKQWIDTLTYVINLARKKRQEGARNTPRNLKVKINGLIPLPGHVEIHAVLVATSGGSNFSFISPILSANIPQNATSAALIQTVPSECYLNPGPLKLRVIQLNSSLSALPRLIQSKTSNASQTLDLTGCVQSRVIAENDIDVDLCKTVAETNKTVVVSIVNSIATAHLPPPPSLSPAGAAVINQTRTLIANVRTQAKISEEQAQEAKVSTAARNEILKHVEKKWFPHFETPRSTDSNIPISVMTSTTTTIPSTLLSLSSTSSTSTPLSYPVNLSFLSPPRAQLVRTATAAVRRAIEQEEHMNTTEIVQSGYPLSSHYDDHLDEAMGAVNEIIARRSVKRGVSATPNRLGASQSQTTIQSQFQATESTPRSARIVSSSSSSPSLHHHHQQKYSTLSTKSPERQSSSSSTTTTTIKKKVVISESPAILPIQSIEDEVKNIILLLRPVIQTEPLRSIKESSTLLLKRFFARFGEGSPRFVPFFRFQDLCLQLIGRTTLSNAQINAVFVLANTLEFSIKSQLATTLEDSLDFISFSNALLILSLLINTKDQQHDTFDPSTCYSLFIKKNLQTLARRLKITSQSRKEGGSNTSIASSNISFVSDDAFSFIQENISINESSLQLECEQLILKEEEVKEEEKEKVVVPLVVPNTTITDIIIDSPKRNLETSLSKEEFPITDLSPLPQVLFNLLKESSPVNKNKTGKEKVLSSRKQIKTTVFNQVDLLQDETNVNLNTMKTLATQEEDADKNIKRLTERIKALDISSMFSEKSPRAFTSSSSSSLSSSSSSSFSPSVFSATTYNQEKPLELKDLKQTISVTSPSPITSSLLSNSSSNGNVNIGKQEYLGSTLSTNHRNTYDTVEVRSIFDADHTAISIVFKHYADLRVNQITSLSSKKKNKGLDDVTDTIDRNLLLLTDVLKFAHDFEIIPLMVSAAQFAMIYSSVAVSSIKRINRLSDSSSSSSSSRASKQENTSTSTTTTTQSLHLSDFTQLLIRVALYSFSEYGPRFQPKQAAIHFLRSLDESKGRIRMTTQDASCNLFRFGRYIHH
jgi:hypothetical protein